MQEREETAGGDDHNHRYRNDFKYLIFHSLSPLPDAVAGYALADGIGADYQNEVNDLLGKSDRGTEAEVCLLQTDTGYEAPYTIT